jgi:uncharacterized membrane protein YhaH (DUF805 family)
MGFVEAISSGFGKYATFSGRACRSEYWYFLLFYIVVLVVAVVIDIVVFPSLDIKPVQLIAILALFLPTIAVAIRRLHDLDRTGWWYLIAFTGIGGIVLFVWYCMKGTTGPNRFGPDPIPGG